MGVSFHHVRRLLAAARRKCAGRRDAWLSVRALFREVVWQKRAAIYRPPRRGARRRCRCTWREPAE
jgi:hypothetical protein